MWKQVCYGVVLTLLICAIRITKAGSSVLLRNERESESSSEKKLTKRGHFGDLNEYGPATHISSSVLQFEQSPDIEINEHNDIHHEELDGGEWKEPPIWNSIALGWQPVHKIVDSSGDEYVHPSGFEENTFSHSSTKGYLPQGGLHTQIISSSGIDLSQLSDKIDLNNVVDLKEKHYIKSYG